MVNSKWDLGTEDEAGGITKNALVDEQQEEDVLHVLELAPVPAKRGRRRLMIAGVTLGNAALVQVLRMILASGAAATPAGAAATTAAVAAGGFPKALAGAGVGLVPLVRMLATKAAPAVGANVAKRGAVAAVAGVPINAAQGTVGALLGAAAAMFM